MTSSIELPYYRDASLLPSLLPTTAEIENAGTTMPSIRDPRYGGRIVIVKGHYVAKYGSHHIAENEGHALLFIEKNLSIPAPRLHAMYYEAGKLYMVMDLMPGRNLELHWPDLSNDEKISIAGDLRQICDQMRGLPSPGFFGSVNGGPLLHRFFLTMHKDPRITGPFKTEQEFGSALALRSQENWACNNRRGWISEFFARHLPAALKDHRSTFTHSDLHRQNILVDKVATSDGVGRFVVSGIVDWESAGWYPSYWEYAASLIDFQWGDDWPEKYELAVDPWPLEAAMLKMVRQDLDY
ncbi:hypothetical protein FKW77_008407 [Venturia effusa]|uniref:Aminoglycoside phosphotransferase domain-containing protein n=1 Tax=Venturia effusa TaxID=50376 RepID=A0A517L3V4_9PEZI|nr:hypothetical protein FKW77_008407 [Venturia effusa]